MGLLCGLEALVGSHRLQCDVSYVVSGDIAGVEWKIEAAECKVCWAGCFAKKGLELRVTAIDNCWGEAEVSKFFQV